jgi:hypothetical protein
MFQFNGLSGVNSSTQGALDGWSIADQLGGRPYSGYAGEMALIFANESDVPDGLGVPRGTFLGDSSGSYADDLGLVVYCIDLNTEFKNSVNPSDVFLYEAHTLESAESRYLAEGVNGYRSGGLKRAAYLIENYYDSAHAAGDLAAASLQAAIWEVLTDTVPSLVPDDGDYSLRNDTIDSVLNLRSNQMVALTNAWFAAADAAKWGGADYDPGNRVAFWLDPSSVHVNQSVISINPDPEAFELVPEPSSGLLVMLGGLVSAFRRRRVA